jgi:endonuclease YncB( thermonuclease family)
MAVVVSVAAIAFYATLTAPWLGPAPPASLHQAAQVDDEPADQRGRFSCAVAYINDGDTLRCQDGTRIRLHAVAARERDGSCSPGHPCPTASAGAATAELSRLAGGKILRCEPTGHSYNRITAICWTPTGEEINCAMVRSGTALLWDRFDRQAPLCRP